MNIITDEKLSKRNTRIGQIASLIGLLVLAGGLYISFTQPEQFSLTMVLLLVGFTLSQIGIYFGNRWGRLRQDKLLSQALKGLDGRYALYHYSGPSSHLLVGPAGIWVLLPRYQRGVITYDKGQWRQKGGGVWLAYLKFFAQEGIGRPDLEIAAETENVRKFLLKQMAEEELPEIKAALIFSNDRAVLEADDAPTPTIPLKKLKDLIRKAQKESPLQATKYKAIQEAIEAKA